MVDELRRLLLLGVFLTCFIGGLPVSTWAQTDTTGAIAGAVKDITGGVLPGVTVEAASPALIEKVRTAVTDSDGQYRIVELRPGTYTVTFTLPGFATIRREGIQLTTGFTATVNGDLQPGEVAETITVTGGSPIVDTHNVRTQTVLSAERLSDLPTAPTVSGLAQLTLGATGAGSDVGGNRGETRATFAVNGGHGTDQEMTVDGMLIGTWYASASARNIVVNQVSIAETTIVTGGISAESETAGVQLVAISKDGGNRFSSLFNGTYANSDMQSSNLNDELRDRGLTGSSQIKRVYDWGVGVGGPIKRDRIWFYGASRWWGAQEYQPNAYFNASPNRLLYTPDLSRPAYLNQYNQDFGGRVTWQATSKQKVTVSDHFQDACQCYGSVSATLAPEATRNANDGGLGDGIFGGRQQLIMVGWTYPITNRLLIDAGAAFGLFYLSQSYSPGTTTDDISVTELSTGLQYNALGGSLFSPVYSTDPVTGRIRNNRSWNLNQKVTVSYVTGSHAFKVGYIPAFGFHDQVRSLNQSVTYFFRNQAPASLTQWASPAMMNTRLRTAGYYAQDQWTVKRLTMNLGLRFDTFHAHTLPVDLPPSRFIPARHFDGVDDVPNWKDVNPRLGLAYDLFGNGKTAVKVSLGRYVSSMGVTIAEQNNPAQAIVSSTSRTWNDVFFPVGDPRRGNLVPDCDLMSPVGNEECGPMSARNFGTTAIATRYDEDVLTHRDYNWQASASVQHELTSGVSLTFGYYRTSYGNFRVTDNLAIGPEDHSPFCVTVPVDSRLPNSDSQLCGLYDISPTKFGLLDNVITSASNYGKATEVYNGFQGSVNARLGRRGSVSGGISSGQTEFDNCFVTDSPQSLLFCNTKLPWRAQTQVKFNGTYELPGDLQVAGVFQTLGGAPIAGSYVATNAQVQSSLGRNLGQCGAAATCTGTVTIPNLFEPNTQFEDRLTQLDVRLAKIFRLGSARVRAMADVYNLLNANTVLASNGRYAGPNSPWPLPTAVLGARTFKFGAELTF